MSAVHLLKGLIMNSAIWQTYREQLFNFILKKVPSYSVAEDIVQDVLLTINEEIDTLREQEKLLSWMFRITRNEIAQYYRKKKEHIDIESLHLFDDDTKEASAQKELSTCLRPMIEALPNIYKEALTLGELEELPQSEVAKRLNISLSGAKSRIQRGRAILQKQFTDNCNLTMDSKGSIMDYHCQCKSC